MWAGRWIWGSQRRTWLREGHYWQSTKNSTQVTSPHPPGTCSRPIKSHSKTCWFASWNRSTLITMQPSALWCYKIMKQLTCSRTTSWTTLPRRRDVTTPRMQLPWVVLTMQVHPGIALRQASTRHSLRSEWAALALIRNQSKKSTIKTPRCHPLENKSEDNQCKVVPDVWSSIVAPN